MTKIGDGTDLLTKACRLPRPFIAMFFLLLAPSAGTQQSSAAKTKTTWSGYLIDVLCARERKDKESDLGWKHTKKCMQMPVCDRGGFGLLTDANELLVFDENGNRKVRSLLQQIKQEANLRVIVQGTKSNEVLEVQKIERTKR